jgi:hypothetical protein
MEVFRLREMLTSSALNYVLLLAAIPALIKLHEDTQMWGDYLATRQRTDYVPGQKEIFDFVISK